MPPLAQRGVEVVEQRHGTLFGGAYHSAHYNRSRVHPGYLLVENDHQLPASNLGVNPLQRGTRPRPGCHAAIDSDRGMATTRTRPARISSNAGPTTRGDGHRPGVGDLIGLGSGRITTPAATTGAAIGRAPRRLQLRRLHRESRRRMRRWRRSIRPDSPIAATTPSGSRSSNLGHRTEACDPFELRQLAPALVRSVTCRRRKSGASSCTPRKGKTCRTRPPGARNRRFPPQFLRRRAA